jgi:hypothetical protein
VGFWRRKRDLRELGEAEAYAHSYGHAREDVRIVRLPPRRPRDHAVLASGELLRRAFLDRLDAREEQAARDE